MTESELLDTRARMAAAKELDAKEVEALYSTKPIRARLGSMDLAIPVNYFTPKGAREKEILDGRGGFGFKLFMPNFIGYTKHNWKDRFDPNLVQVLEVSSGNSHRTAEALFESRKASLEPSPSFQAHELKGYRRKLPELRGLHWTGTTSHGEFFVLESTLAPGEKQPYPDHNPLCSTQYFSQKYGLFIAYMYSQRHISQWRQIDDGIWRLLHSWRIN